MSKIKRKIKNLRYSLQQIYNKIIENRKCLTSIEMFNSEENDKYLVINKDEKIYRYYKKTFS